MCQSAPRRPRDGQLRRAVCLHTGPQQLPLTVTGVTVRGTPDATQLLCQGAGPFSTAAFTDAQPNATRAPLDCRPPTCSWDRHAMAATSAYLQHPTAPPDSTERLRVSVLSEDLSG